MDFNSATASSNDAPASRNRAHPWPLNIREMPTALMISRSSRAPIRAIRHMASKIGECSVLVSR